ncbi:MAG: hypothetical protein JHD07_20845 [Bradyrhizobium sp.]|jgi:hypothetical protein|uniref:hypothetical protein n=1 Tax=Bradyrhizobium japonicum TaxID=375 RepID=UPI000429C739|nr:hypothetical protein [Bradyrhizobium sp.]
MIATTSLIAVNAGQIGTGQAEWGLHEAAIKAFVSQEAAFVHPLSRCQFWDLSDRLRARRAGRSVVVATAYMSEGFVWLIAMNDGKIFATSAPSDLKGRTSTRSIEDAFITLLRHDSILFSRRSRSVRRTYPKASPSSSPGT